MELDSTNSKLSTLEIVRNPLELEKNGEREVPKGMNSFTGLQAGGFSENYKLNEGYINTYTDQILAFIENNKSRMPKDKVDEFTSELKLIKLDVESSNDKSENKLKSAIKEILAVEKAAFDLAYSHHHHSHDNDGGHNDSTHSEDGFEFNIEDITDESGEGFVVAHGDHYHYVFFKDLTEDQIAQGREHLKKLKENQSNNPKEDTSPKDNTKTDDELEAEFEKELNSLASSMHVSPDSIRIEDGYMIVDHGDHDHRYKIKSDGWKIYIQNKIPHIEIPTISGSVDRSQVYREIAKIRERVNSELTGAKKRRALAWLDKFKDEDLAYGFTSTEGYLQGLKNFTDSQLDNKNSENENPKDVEDSETPKANSETTTTAEGNENTIDKENRTEGVSPESSNQNMATEESNGDSTNISSEESSDNVTNSNSEESNINDSGEVSNNENEEVSSTEISTVDNESAPSEDEALHSAIESN